MLYCIYNTLAVTHCPERDFVCVSLPILTISLCLAACGRPRAVTSSKRPSPGQRRSLRAGRRPSPRDRPRSAVTDASQHSAMHQGLSPSATRNRGKPSSSSTTRAARRRSPFDPDGMHLFSAGYDGTIREWDLARRSQIRVLSAKARGTIWTVDLSPDGKRIAAGGEDAIIRIWNLGQSIRQLRSCAATHAISGRCASAPTANDWPAAASIIRFGFGMRSSRAC